MTTAQSASGGTAWRGSGEVAYVSDNELGILDNRGRVHRLSGPGIASQPAWSADGRWVAFLRAAVPPAHAPYDIQPARLWVASSDRTGAHALSSPCSGWTLRPRRPWRRQDAAGEPGPGTKTAKVLATTLVHTNWLSWSPDGKTLAIVAGGDRSLWDGGTQVETCQAGSGGCTSVAAPAGTMTLEPAGAARDGSLVVVRAPGSSANNFGPPPGVPGASRRSPMTVRR